MKNLNLISDDELHSQTLTASNNEKVATLALLEHLAEVNSRRLFAIRGYSSLWEYCHKALSYSEAQASDRVNAVKLMIKVPEIKKDLEKGNLSLTTAAKLGSHVIREKCEINVTRELLQNVVGKSSRAVEMVLAAESTAAARPDKIKMISKQTTRITLDVDQTFLDLVTRTKEICGHPGSSVQDVLKSALRDFVKRREVKSDPITEEIPHRSANKDSKRTSSLPRMSELSATKLPPLIKGNTQSSLRAPACKNESASKLQSRYIPALIKTKIRFRSGDQCEYVDPITRRRCECRTKLQFDHTIPFAKNGPSAFENLRQYCPAHNQLAAIQIFGKVKMRKYININ